MKAYSVSVFFFPVPHSQLRTRLNVRFRARQKTLVNALERGDVAVLQVAFDETEQRLSINLEGCGSNYLNTTVSTMMVHGILHWRLGSQDQVLNLACAPAILPDTSAASLLGGIANRLPFNMAELAGKVNTFVVVLISDAAKACRKVSRVLTSMANGAFLVLHNKCIMHQVSLSVNYCQLHVNMLGVLFCSSTLVHQGRAYDALLRNVRRLLGSPDRFQITLTPPRDEDKLYLKRALEMLDWDETLYRDHDLQRKSQSKAKKQKARDEFARMFTGDVRCKTLKHYCPLGCCPLGRDQSVDKAVDAFKGVLLSSLPEVPAVNRWTKLYPAVAWWLCALLLGGVVSDAWIKLHTSQDEEDGIQVEDLMGPQDTETHRAIARSRQRKSIKFISDPETPLKLCAFGLAMRPTLMIMGFLFRTGQLHAEHCILDILGPNNPVERTIAYYCQALQDLRSDFWLILRKMGQGWGDKAMQLGVDAVLRMIGGLFMRLVLPYQGPPWNLWPLASAETSQNERAELIKSTLLQACPNCLDPFAMHFKRCAESQVDLAGDDAAARRVLQAAFKQCPCTNILSEDRFARSSNQRQHTRGRAQSDISMMTNHVISEVFSQHQRTLARHKAENLGTVTPVCLKGASAQSSFTLYFAEEKKRNPGKTMAEISETWAALPLETRGEYSRRAQALRKEVVSDSPEQPIAVENTPLKLSATEMPVDAASLQPYSTNQASLRKTYSEYCQKYRGTVQPCLLPESAQGSEAKLCCDLYGPGVCQETLTPRVQSAIRKNSSLLSLAARALRNETNVVLLRLVPTGAASSEGPTGVIYALLLAAVFKDPSKAVFLRCSGGPDELSPTLSMDGLRSDSQLALQMAAEADDWKVERVRYTLRASPLTFIAAGTADVEYPARPSKVAGVDASAGA